MSMSILAFAAAFVLFVTVVSAILNRNHRRRMRILAAERSGESICQFVRSLPYRRLDTTVIRRVYEAVQAEVSVPDCRVPLRITDHCTDTLEMDPEDFDDLVVDLADRCGRSLDGYRRNPFYSYAGTVGGLVQFLCAQPKSQ